MGNWAIYESESGLNIIMLIHSINDHIMVMRLVVGHNNDVIGSEALGYQLHHDDAMAPTY